MIWGYIAVMALVTYLIRALPLTLIHGRIRNKWIRSFLYYVPYACLSAMTFPAFFMLHRVCGVRQQVLLRRLCWHFLAAA